MSIFILAATLPVFGQGSDNLSFGDHVNRGNQYLQQHQFEQALKEYEAAKLLEPSNAVVRHNIVECHNNWGIYYFRRKNYDESIAQFEKTLALDPNHKQAKYNLNLCHQIMKRTSANKAQIEDKVKKASSKPAGPDEGKLKANENSGKLLNASPASPVDTPSPTNSNAAATLYGSTQPANDASTFVSGSSAYPTYNATPSAVSSPVLPATANTAASAPNSSSSLPAESSPAIPGLADDVKNKAIEAPERKEQKSSPESLEASIEDRLSTLELKVYGDRQNNLSVIKRLEKLEMETSGQLKTGNINDRIQSLKKSVGI